MGLVDRATVQRVFTTGVEAVESVASGITGDDWSRPACGVWSAADTVRHVLSVVGWYHHWLDRAMEGDVTIPFPAERMDEETARSLEAVAGVSTDEAVARFGTEARRYLGRLDDSVWDIPFAYPRGVVTPGLHAGMAALEWHVHAWDLSSVGGTRYVPDDPVSLYLAAADCQAALAHRLEADAFRESAPLAAKDRPWDQLLKRTGRDPVRT